MRRGMRNERFRDDDRIPGALQGALHTPYKLEMAFHVVQSHRQSNASAIKRHAIVRVRQILRKADPVHPVAGETIAHEARKIWNIGGQHATLQLSEHLHLAHRPPEIFVSEIPVIDRERLLKDRRIDPVGQDHQRALVVHHLVTADDAGRVCGTCGCGAVSRAEQQGSAIDRVARNDEERRRQALDLPVSFDFDSLDAPVPSTQFSRALYFLSTKTVLTSQFSGSRGTKSPRSIKRTLTPFSASRRAVTPPPMPLR